MGLFDKLFGKPKQSVIVGAGFSTSAPHFNREVYEQDTVRAIIDCIARHTAKAEAMHVRVDKNERIMEIQRNSPYARMLNVQPNPLMSGYDFKYRQIAQLEAYTTAMVYIKWDGMRPVMMIPIPCRGTEIFALKDGGYAVRFTDDSGTVQYFPLEDMVMLRKQYMNHEVMGDGHGAIRDALSLAKAASDSFIDAVSIGNRVRGFLQSTMGMLKPEDRDDAAKIFNEQYRAAAKEGGVVVMDKTQSYAPMTVTPWSANAAQMREVRENLLRYWGVSEAVLTSNYTESQWQAFYESIIEPHLVRMGQAYTNACFTPNEYAHGNRIRFNASTLLHASVTTRVQLLGAMREIGLFTINEQREMLGYPPVEGGDKRETSLNYVDADKQNEYQLGEKEEPVDGQEPEASETV